MEANPFGTGRLWGNARMGGTAIAYRACGTVAREGGEPPGAPNAVLRPLVERWGLPATGWVPLAVFAKPVFEALYHLSRGGADTLPELVTRLLHGFYASSGGSQSIRGPFAQRGR